MPSVGGGPCPRHTRADAPVDGPTGGWVDGPRRLPPSEVVTRSTTVTPAAVKRPTSPRTRRVVTGRASTESRASCVCLSAPTVTPTSRRTTPVSVSRGQEEGQETPAGPATALGWTPGGPTGSAPRPGGPCPTSGDTCSGPSTTCRTGGGRRSMSPDTPGPSPGVRARVGRGGADGRRVTGPGVRGAVGRP